MRGPAAHTAEVATRGELWRASLRLFVMFLALAVLALAVLQGIPLGATTRVGLLAWLLVALALYWLYAGMGYQPLLLLQLVLFSAAAALLTTKAMLVLVSINRLSVLRRTAQGLVAAGAVIGLINLGAMLVSLLRRRLPRPSAPGT
ncbi:MAG TPA: hypothetical protein VFK09_11430 [Gemmatimonadales bacterium]|nr:hypothetical protein [Gemmatimonadales bacterium]